MDGRPPDVMFASSQTMEQARWRCSFFAAETESDAFSRPNRKGQPGGSREHFGLAQAGLAKSASEPINSIRGRYRCL